MSLLEMLSTLLLLLFVNLRFATIYCNDIEEDDKTLTLLCLMPWTRSIAIGPTIGSSIVLALEEVERRQLLPGYTIGWIHKDSECVGKIGMKMAIETKLTTDIDGIIGDVCSVACVPESLLAAAWNIPVVSFSCASNKLSDKNVHPTFSRTVGLYVDLAPMFNSILDQFQWNVVGILSDDVDAWLQASQEMLNVFTGSGKTAYLYTASSTITEDVDTTSTEKIRTILQKLKQRCRIVVVMMYPLDFRNVLALAYEEGMLDGRFAYLGPEGEIPLDDSHALRPDLTTEFLYQGVLDGVLALKEGAAWDSFRQDVIDTFQTPQFDKFKHVPADASIDVVDSYSGMLYDAVLMWAYGVNKTLKQGHAPNDGFKITQNIFNMTFEGITGTVAIDYKGDRLSDYKIDIIQGGQRVSILYWNGKEEAMTKLYRTDQEGDWTGLFWSANSTVVPVDTPACGWQSELCEDNDNKLPMIIATVVAISAFKAVMLSTFIYKLRKKQKLVEARKYLVKWEDVQKININQNSMISLASNFTIHDEIQIYIENVRYNGEIAAVKNIDIGVNISTIQILDEIKDIMSLHHENINGFLGICLEAPRTCVLMAYTSRGSLQDVLANEAVNITWDFKTSLITDVAKGMKALHASEIGVHGHLTSANCVIDLRFICKITDYGFNKYRKASHADGEVANKLLWTAPEMFKDDSSATKMADIYSFSIICQEVLLQTCPYGEDHDLTAPDIIARVKQNSNPPFRPNIPSENVKPEWLHLLKMCWAENPEERPSFAKIVNSIRDMREGNDISIVDSMIIRLENHTNSLEETVMKRSSELYDEKEKMERLLQELLPSSIAHKLKVGERIEPEYFDSVTIFFSDIVGFTRISAAGTPVDVVRMLNSMYTHFDDVSSKFDVYKVATIGDAYFVASGVPVKNGKKHAQEICMMATKLLKTVSKVEIAHCPGEILSLRIGIHSGPCVAGVAGIKMPRYLLFGDTVDIASHMESGGESMRIHISQTTADLVLNMPHFQITTRGQCDIKGLGFVTTYWLD